LSREGSPLPRLLRGKRSRLLALLVANGVAQASAAYAITRLVRLTFHHIGHAASVSAGSLAPLAVALTGAAVALGLLRARERADAERLGQSYVHALRTVMYERLSELSPRTLEGRSQGAVMLRFVNDLTSVSRWVSLGLARLVVGTTFFAGALVALALLSVPIAAAVAAVVVLGAAAALLAARALNSSSREARRKRSRLAANVNEKLGSMAVVQVFGQAEREQKRLRRQSTKLRRAMVAKAAAAGRLRGLSEITVTMASIAVLLVGAHEVGTGHATRSTILAALAIMGLLVNPLRDLARVNEYRTNARISFEKITTLLETPNQLREKPGAPDLSPREGRLELVGVSVDDALREVSAVAEPGTVTAVVGPNGAGKSTLLAVAARLIDPDRGHVLLDGQDLAEHSVESVRRAISMTGPDLPLLRGSVDDNVRYRSPEAPPEEIERVVALCSLEQVFAELPAGRETKVLAGGRNLSAGQRQRLALARALVGDPVVLLLDEADANLDAEARGLLEHIVATQRGRATVVVVTHRPELVELADAVWQLHDGRLEVVSTASREPAMLSR
jgi:ABC-type multidrug transport system fused ATPase/permease subunit